MSYSKFIVPGIRVEEIRIASQKFREKYCDSTIPVEVEEAIEIELKIDIVPVPQMRDRCDTDALIASNWELIYVDQRLYEDDRQANRLRFTLAHEIAHRQLHQDIYASLAIDSLEDFYVFNEDVPRIQYSRLEWQANEFASHLIMPRMELQTARNRLLKAASTELADMDVSRDVLDSVLATSLAKDFGVSEQAMRIALSSLTDMESED